LLSGLYAVDYSLTEFGQSLESVIKAMHDWGEEYLSPPGGEK